MRIQEKKNRRKLEKMHRAFPVGRQDFGRASYKRAEYNNMCQGRGFTA